MSPKSTPDCPAPFTKSEVFKRGWAPSGRSTKNSTSRRTISVASSMRSWSDFAKPWTAARGYPARSKRRTNLSRRSRPPRKVKRHRAAGGRFLRSSAKLDDAFVLEHVEVRDTQIQKLPFDGGQVPRLHVVGVDR